MDSKYYYLGQWDKWSLYVGVQGGMSMAIGPSAMLRAVSMQPGHADARNRTSLMQTAQSATDNVI